MSGVGERLMSKKELDSGLVDDGEYIPVFKKRIQQSKTRSSAIADKQRDACTCPVHVSRVLCMNIAAFCNPYFN